MRDLKIGGRYLTNGGYFVRTIIAFKGDRIQYMDQGGCHECLRTTFTKHCREVLAPEALEQPQPAPSLPVDRNATNKLLEIVLHIQNQSDAWFKTLEQTADYHSSVLTPAQITLCQALQESYVAFSKQIRHCQDELMRGLSSRE